VVTWQAPRADSILAGVNRFEEEDGRIARIWEYYFCPDTIAEIAAALGARAVSHGYRHAPGVLSRDAGAQRIAERPKDSSMRNRSAMRRWNCNASRRVPKAEMALRAQQLALAVGGVDLVEADITCRKEELVKV